MKIKWKESSCKFMGSFSSMKKIIKIVFFFPSSAKMHTFTIELTIAQDILISKKKAHN